jgi:ketosteroid isomerase-like protein
MRCTKIALMSRNVALLRRLYDTWNQEGLGFFETARELLDPAMEFREPPEFPGAGTYRGVEGWRTAMSQQLEGWERILFEPDEFLESGDKVFCAVRVRTLGKETQIETERVIFHVVTIREHRILRLRVFFERTPALAELGLEGGRTGEATPVQEHRVDRS